MSIDTSFCFNNESDDFMNRFFGAQEELPLPHYSLLKQRGDDKLLFLSQDDRVPEETWLPNNHKTFSSLLGIGPSPASPFSSFTILDSSTPSSLVNCVSFEKDSLEANKETYHPPKNIVIPSLHPLDILLPLRPPSPVPLCSPAASPHPTSSHMSEQQITEDRKRPKELDSQIEMKKNSIQLPIYEECDKLENAELPEDTPVHPLSHLFQFKASSTKMDYQKVSMSETDFLLLLKSSKIDMYFPPQLIGKAYKLFLIHLVTGKQVKNGVTISYTKRRVASQKRGTSELAFQFKLLAPSHRFASPTDYSVFVLRLAIDGFKVETKPFLIRARKQDKEDDFWDYHFGEEEKESDKEEKKKKKKKQQKRPRETQKNKPQGRAPKKLKTKK